MPTVWRDCPLSTDPRRKLRSARDRRHTPESLNVLRSPPTHPELALRGAALALVDRGRPAVRKARGAAAVGLFYTGHRTARLAPTGDRGLQGHPI